MHDTVGQLLSHQVPHTRLCGFLMKPHHVLMTEHPAVTHGLVTEAEKMGEGKRRDWPWPWLWPWLWPLTNFLPQLWLHLTTVPSFLGLLLASELPNAGSKHQG